MLRNFAYWCTCSFFNSCFTKRIFSSIEMTKTLLLNKFHSVEILDNLSVAILRSITYQNICHTMRSSMPEWDIKLRASWTHSNVNFSYQGWNLGKNAKNKSTRMGFEPTRGDPNGLAVHRLNHSATSSC